MCRIKQNAYSFLTDFTVKTGGKDMRPLNNPVVKQAAVAMQAAIKSGNDKKLNDAWEKKRNKYKKLQRLFPLMISIFNFGSE